MRRALARLAVWLLVVGFGSAAGARAGAPMLFRDACPANGGTADRIIVAGVGDLLFHEVLQRQALTPESSYASYFSAVAPVLTGADITYGNLEGPAAFGVVQGGKVWKDPGRVYDGKVYGTAKDALIFNYHPSVIGDLKAAGFTVVSTANNHAADRRALGIDRTIDALDAAGLNYTGTRRRLAAAGEPGAQLAGEWSTVTEARRRGASGRSGMRVAWLACTFGTNSLPDPHSQVLLCYQDRDTVMAELARLAADPSVSAVILTPHWGDEGARKPKPGDRLYARAAIEAGATAVIGTHPHVLQPWEQVETSDGRQGLVIYSTGNFLSNQHTTAQRSGIVSLLELTRHRDSGKARLTAAGFVPTWVDKHNDAGHRIVEQVDGNTYVGVPAPGAKPRPVKRAPVKAAREAEPADGLAATLKLLPANRVALASFRDLPRGDCPPPEPVPAVPDAPPVSMVVADAAPVPSPPYDAVTELVSAVPEARPPVSIEVAEAPPVPSPVSEASAASPASATLIRVAGAISFVAAALPRLPAPVPHSRADPVLRTRRPSRPSDIERDGHLLNAHDAEKTRGFNMTAAAAASAPPITADAGCPDSRALPEPVIINLAVLTALPGTVPLPDAARPSYPARPPEQQNHSRKRGKGNGRRKNRRR